MPDVDGAALLKGIRITQSKVDLPVIVCSGSRDRSDYVRVSQHGVQGILQKPIKRAELLVCLQGALSGSEYDASSENLPVFDHQAALHREGGDKNLLLELVVGLLQRIEDAGADNRGDDSKSALAELEPHLERLEQELRAEISA